MQSFAVVVAVVLMTGQSLVHIQIRLLVVDGAIRSSHGDVAPKSFFAYAVFRRHPIQQKVPPNCIHAAKRHTLSVKNLWHYIPLLLKSEFIVWNLKRRSIVGWPYSLYIIDTQWGYSCVRLSSITIAIIAKGHGCGIVQLKYNTNLIFLGVILGVKWQIESGMQEGVK